MSRHASFVLSFMLLSGCAGYAADYWKPKQSLIASQLPRYRITGESARCVEKHLTDALSVWQLRQLADLAGRLTPGGKNPAALSSRDFLYIAGLVEDPKVGPEAQRVLESCNATAPVAAGASPAGSATPSTATVPAAPQEPLWVNLGAAQTGQGIAVDATSVTRGPSWRQAWFRLLNGNQPNVGDIGYLLRIDCPAKNIMALAGRKYTPGGTLAEQKDYPTPEGPMAIETGTVIEVAYHALCD